MRYATYDQELLALIRALEKWRRLLLMADITAFTDHRALQYLLKLKTDKPIGWRVARWLTFLSDFQSLKVVYPPGAGEVVADAIFRCPLHEEVTGENTTKGKADEMGSQQTEIDVAKDLVFALREVRLETEAFQGACYKGLTLVAEDQQVPLLRGPSFLFTYKRKGGPPGINRGSEGCGPIPKEPSKLPCSGTDPQ